jgi:hypothetical protein
MKFTNKKESQNTEIKHDFTKINACRQIAYAFAKENDDFRKKAFQEKYSREKNDALKITAYETRVEFAILRSYASELPNSSYPLGYEYEPYSFRKILKDLNNEMLTELYKGNPINP